MNKEEAIAAGQRAVAAGDIQAANEIAAYIDREYPENPQMPITTELMKNFREFPKAAGQALEEGWDEFDPGKLPIQNIATGIRTAGEVGGAAVGTLEPLVPEWVKETASDVWEWYKETPEGTLLLDIVGHGVEAYENYKSSLPEEQQRILEDIIDYSAIAAPRVINPGNVQNYTKKGEYKFKRAASEQSIAERRQGIERMIRPDNMEGEGEVLEVGPLRRKKYQMVPDTHEDRVTSALEIVPEVDHRRSYTYNHNKVQEAATQHRKDLEKLIRKSKNPQIDMEKLDVDFATMLDEMDKLPGFHALGPSAQTLAKQQMRELENIISGYGDKKLTAMDILNIRREFDKRVMRSGGKYDADVENAKIFSARHIRNLLNEELKNVLPGDEAHHLLYMQHQLLSGRDILRGKRAKEASNALTRSWSALKNTLHLPSTPAALILTGTMAAPFAPYIGAGVATTGGLWMGYRQLTKPQRKRMLGAMLKTMDQAIEKTKDSALIADLKADRIILYDLLQDEEEAVDESPQ